MNKQIQKIVEDFNFNSIRDNNDKACSFAENLLGLVDLGLPSGTLWMNCNLGANNEYEYGDYYSWGELNTKDEFTEINYTYKDNPNQLPPEHDVVTQKLGNNYCIPTKEQWEELLDYTVSRWVKNYKGTDVNGRLFTSKINNNSIFIPAAGCRTGNNYNIGSNGYIWSSSNNTYTYSTTAFAWYLRFNNENACMNYYGRSIGRSIRPVFKK